MILRALGPPAGLLQALLLCAFIAGPVNAARAHNGYDAFCCDNRDCGPYPKAEVQSVDGGWMVRPTPEADPIFFKTDAYRVSEDGQTHLCIYQGQARCIYLAPRT